MTSPHDHHDHDHHHGHDHDGHDHAHTHAPEVTMGNEARVFCVMLLTGIFMIVEAAGGLISGSLALLADAGHMLTDTGALLLSWLAFRMVSRPSDPKRSYGYHRFQILAAFANGLALFAIALWIMAEAIGRLMNPVAVMGWPMMAIAAAGLVVNIIGFAILSRGGHDNLNIRSAALHVMGDLLGSVAAIVAAIIIVLTGWVPIDPILSVLVAVLILRSAWSVIRQSAHILLEGTPEGIDAARIGAALAGIPGLVDIHHVHAWSLSDAHPIVTFHAVLEQGADQTPALAEIHSRLKERFGITHATVQFETAGAPCGDGGPC